MQAVDELLNDGQALHVEGRFDEARTRYEAVLALDADNGLAHYLLGCVCLQTGDSQSAVDHMETAIKAEDEFFDARCLLGTLYFGQGRHWESAYHLEIAERLDPTNFVVQLGLANARAAAGSLELAEAGYRKALELDPESSDAHSSFGFCLSQIGRPAEAETEARRAIELDPANAVAYNNLAIALGALERPREAEEAVRTAVSLSPALGEAWLGLVTMLLQEERLDEAVNAANEAVGAGGARPELIERLTDVLVELKRAAEAEPWLRWGVQQWPNSVPLMDRLASALLTLDRLDEADAWARAALALSPDDVTAMAVFQFTLRKMGRPAEALPYARRACELVENPSRDYDLWNTLLSLGEYREGWEVYERWMNWRHFKMRHFDRDRWNGEPLPFGTLLVYADHGFGDTIADCRYLTLAKSKFRGRLLVECAAPLAALLATVEGVDSVVVVKEDRSQPDVPFDRVIGMRSLNHLFDVTLETLPNDVPYLHPHRVRVDRWRERLGSSGALKIGVCWCGDPTNQWEKDRSCPRELIEGLAGPGRELFSLVVRGEPGDMLTDLRSDLTDFAETAAAIESMDLVITIDTSVAHLAGALGKPTWLLISYFCPWQWLIDREDTPWYPTARLFRQPVRGDWKSVIDRVRAEISLLPD